MRAADLRLEELVSFSEGVVSLHGRRLIIHDIHAMAHLRKDLVETIGMQRSRRILTRFGYFWGEADASAMQRILEWDRLEEWVMAGPRLHELQGVAKVEVQSLEVNPETGRFHAQVIWHNPSEAEEQIIGLGPSPDAGCWITQGYASGYASLCLGKPVYFMEESCRGRGDGQCVAVGMDAESWGDEAENLARNFQTEDIQGKIEELTNELRRKTLELARQRKRMSQMPLAVPGAPEIRSKLFHQVLDSARRVARFDSSVLVTGESGVGKEVIARFIHDNSPRHEGPFVAINCSALPETLLESELFGHRAGSFTGAVRDRVGLFEQAQGGTILLDEIGDVPLPLQVKLLRVLQEKKIRRVGENENRTINVRVVAATNRTLDEEVREGRFRDDLFYRLRVVEIHIPPLRARPEDILPLARYFTARLSKRLGLSRLQLDPGCIRRLESYAWPGNVRELENALERAAVMSEDGWIRLEHLPPDVFEPERRRIAQLSGVARTLDEAQREHVLAVLESVGGNRTRAAKILRISTSTLWRKLKQWESGSDDG